MLNPGWDETTRLLPLRKMTFVNGAERKSPLKIN